MRVKRLPEPPPALDAVDEARRAVGRVPDPETDCCARIADRLDCGREAARDWFVLVRALGLVERTDSGYRRTDRDATPESLRESFRSGVYGAEEAVRALGPEPSDAAGVADRIDRPAWEESRVSDPERAWTARTRRLLDWLVLLGLAGRTDEGYRAPESEA